MNVNNKMTIISGMQLASPLVSREQFAQMLFGNVESVGVVVGMINKGYLPTVSIGKYSFINLALLQKKCLDREFSL